jgi:translocation and assembly module TamA
VQVDIEGLEGDPRQNVSAALTLPPGIIREGRVEQRWLERYAKKIPEKVSLAIEPFGYYNSATKVETEQIAEDAYRVHVKITPGPQTIVRSLKIIVTGEGRHEEELLRQIREFPLQNGMPLDHQLYEQGKLNLRLEANNLGYVKNVFTTHSIRVQPGKDAAEVELVLETGPRFYFGETIFVDATESFDKGFLKRFLTYQRDDVFSHRELHLSRINFYGANRFDEVLMVPLMEEVVDHHIPIKVKLVPGKQQRLRPGIGYGTNTGARVSLSYQNMQVGKTPHAHLFDLNIAEKAQFIETSYSVPQEGSVDNNLIGTVGLREEDLKSYETQIIYAEIEQTYGLGRGKTGSLYLRYQHEDSDVGTESNVVQLMIPGVRYYQRSYDDPLNPKSGYQFRLELRGSLDAVISEVPSGRS